MTIEEKEISSSYLHPPKEIESTFVIISYEAPIGICTVFLIGMAQRGPAENMKPL
jgi:hypothetical protein